MTDKTAIETKALEDQRLYVMRNVVGNFLYRTKALHLERDLVDFIMDIDRRHQEEIKGLQQVIESLSTKKDRL